MLVGVDDEVEKTLMSHNEHRFRFFCRSACDGWVHQSMFSDDVCPCTTCFLKLHVWRLTVNDK